MILTCVSFSIELLNRNISELVISSTWLLPLSVLDKIEEACCAFDGVAEQSKHPTCHFDEKQND